MCSIVIGFATLCQPLINSNYYCSPQKARSDLQYFSCFASYLCIFCLFVFAFISVNHLHICLRFTRRRYACISARSQRRWIPKGCDHVSCSSSSPGAKFKNSQSFIFCLSWENASEALQVQVQFSVSYIFIILPFAGNVFLFCFFSLKILGRI